MEGRGLSEGARQAMTNQSVCVWLFLQSLAMLFKSVYKLRAFLLQATRTAMPAFCPLAKQFISCPSAPDVSLCCFYFILHVNLI